MAGNKNFSQTIQYKGQLDVSQIISSLQKIRNELANSSTLKGKDSLFINVDKEMKNIENLSTQLKAAIQKGFSNPKDVKDFERIVNSLDKSFNKVAVDLNGINANKLTQELKSATDELTQQKRALNDIIASEKNNISLQMQSIKHGKTYANTLVQSAKNGEKLEEVQKRITNEIDQQIEKQKQLKTQAEQKVSTATTQLNVAKTNAYKTSFRQSSFKTIDKSGKKTSTTISDEQYSKVNQIFKEVVSNEKTAEKAIEKFNKELQKLGISASKAAINNVSKSFNEIQTSVKPAEAALKTAEAELQKVKKTLDQMTQQKGTVGSVINSQEIVSSYQKIVAAVNSVAQAENNVNAARGKMGSQIPEMQRYATLMNQYRGATQQATQQVGELTEQQQRFDSTFDHLTRYIQYTFSLANGFRMLKQVIQQTFNDVKELDAAFASIAMVTDYSVEQMWASYDDYAEMANRLGQSTKDVIASSALFYQQGLDTAEALELTESTMKLATLAGSDFETATSQMTAALRGFNMEMNEGERITDVYSELAAKAAADVDGIAYAMSKTASIAASAGMEFETTSAFLTQMIETTQEAPENIGTAMKTIIARFTELKENVAGTADSEFEDLDYNKVDTALKSVGISLKDTNGQFRDLDDVFLELAERWSTLDRNSQRYIATIAAGSRQQSRFIAMMEDYDRTVELIDTAYDSAGRSSEQFTKYQDAVEYKLKQLSNTWEQLRTGFLDSDTYKGLIDFANKALNLVRNMDLKQILTVGTIGLTLGKTIITQFIDGIKGNIGILKSSWNSSIEQIFDVNGKGFTKVKNSFKKIFSFNSLKEDWFDLTKQQFNENQFLIGANDILGGKSENAPQLSVQTEVQKTIELQKQLDIYNQLITKGEELNQQSIRERDTKGQISIETQQAISNANQLSIEQLEYLNQLAKELGYEKEITAENAKQIMQQMQENQNASVSKHTKLGQATISGLQSGLSAGITTALMMTISGADLGTVIKSTLTSAFMAALPALVSAIMPMLTRLLLGPGGIVLAVGAAIFAVNSLIDSYIEKKLKAEKAVEKAELKRLENVEEANKKLAEDSDTTAKELVSKKKKLQALDEQVARVEELSEKSFLTSAEQEEFNSLVSKLQEENPELISFYDENTHQLELNTYALQDVRDALLKEITDQEKVLNMQTGLQGLNGKYRIDTIEDKLNNNISDLQFASDQGFYGDYINDINLFKASVTDMNSDFVTDWAASYVDDNVGEMFGQGMTDKEMRDIYSKYLSGYVKNENLNVLDDTISLLNNLTQEQKELIGVASDTVWTADNIGDFVYETATSGQWDGNTAFEQVENRLKTVSEEFETLEDDYKKQVLGRAATSKIGSYVIDGKTLSQDITNILSSNLSSSFEDFEIKEKVSSQGLEGNLLSGAGLQGTEKQDLELILKTYGFGDGEGGIDQSFSEALKAGQESWDKLPEEFRNYLENQAGFDKNTWGDLQQDQINKVLAEFINVNLAGMNLDLGEISEDELQKYSSEIQQYETLLNEQTKYTKDELQKKSLDILSTVSASARDALSLTDDTEVMKKFSELENWGKAVLGDTRLKNFTDLTLGAQQAIQKLTSDANLSTEKTQKFAQALTQMYGTYKTGTQDILKNIDLNSESYSSLLANANEYIKAIADTGEYSLQEARKIYLEYIDTASKYLTKLTFGAEGAEVLANQYNDHFKKIKGDYASLNEAQAEMIENGKISSDTYFQLLEDGMGDYVKVTTNGYELIGDAAEQAFTDQSLVPVKTLRKEIEANKEMLSLYKEINKEQFSVRDTNSGAEYTIDINTVLQQVLNGNMDAFNQLDTKIQDYILTIKNAGYSTQEEFIKALEEGTLAMENMEPDVWVQGLVSISEAVVDADEKIEDLNEELEDLNKQLDEDKAALAEAEDELRQAIHGSDDFQSSLDGLVNYTEKIERLDKAIEKTKEALEDVSDVDEAKGLMAQLNEQYDNKTISLGAENMAIDAALENLRSTLTENYGDYISFDEEGNPLIDFAYMTMDANDEIRKAFEEEYNLYNEYRDKQIDNLDAIAEIEKAKQEQREQALQNFVSIQEDVISILKEKAQEEIDVTKEKYDALEEADNDYLDALQDAIDKQRELRDKQNQYEDLATKEKKLSLLQRDTSGANQKEVLTLQNEIEDDRQNLLDSEIDSMIESMKELYEKQKEARDAEIEYMEEVTEDTQYFAEWASNIMSTWQSAEDMQTWYLENDPNAQDMTVEQTEVYLNEIGDKYSDYVQYIATLATDFTTEQEELNAAMNEMYENTSTNVENIGTVTQDLAQAAADKAIEEATKARDDAKDKLEETQKKIDETTKKLKAAEDTAVQKHEAAMNAMVEASQSSMSKVSTFATKQLAEMLGYDLSKEEDIEKFAKEFNFMNDKGEITQNLYNAISDSGGEASKYKTASAKYEVFSVSSSGNKTSFGFFDTKEEADALYNQKIKEGANKNDLHVSDSGNKVVGTFKEEKKKEHGIIWPDGKKQYTDSVEEAQQIINRILKSTPSNAADGQYKSWAYENNYKIFKTGGLVNYTGPAWVDGTPTKPEAFLNAEDTERIGNAAKILADIPLLNSTSLSENAISSNIGDTSIEIHINVESISSDYDVDQMIERVKNDIIDVSKPVGTSVILKK